MVITFHPSLIFAGKAEPLTVYGKASSNAHKYQTRVKLSDVDKHSSLLWHGIIYGRQKIYKIEGIAQLYNNIYIHNQRMFVKS
jgi:hypothetical protein